MRLLPYYKNRFLGRAASTKARKAKGEKMARQMVKGFSMLMLIVGLALVSGAKSARAQGVTTVIADVPFDFIVANKTLPAGKYSARTTTAAGNAVVIKSADAKNGAYRLVSSTQHKAGKTRARLVFHKYGERYFLSEIWTGPEGVQLLKCRLERSSEREFAALASNTGSTQNRYQSIELVASLR